MMVDMLSQQEFKRLSPNQKANYIGMRHYTAFMVIGIVLLMINLTITVATVFFIAAFIMIRLGFYNAYYGTVAYGVTRTFGPAVPIYEAITGKPFHKILKHKHKSASTLIYQGYGYVIFGICRILFGLVLVAIGVYTLIHYPLFGHLKKF